MLFRRPHDGCARCLAFWLGFALTGAANRPAAEWGPANPANEPSIGAPRAAAPPGMVLIPAGEFEMGDASGLGYADERPSHRVRLDAFYLDRTEVTWALWSEVFGWAVAHGYRFEESREIQPSRGPDHPVCNLAWYEAVKWANARSEREGRTPAYYTDPSHRRIYREGKLDLTADAVSWSGNGYRLPTEAEWERAARGGLEQNHYPWPSARGHYTNFWTQGRANARHGGASVESEPGCATTPVAYYNGNQQPSGPDMANGFGLYDMAGNVAEWCWDWYHDLAYARPEAGQANPRGPLAGYGRVLRGGSWISSDKYCRVAARYVSAPDFRCHCYGLRLALSLP